MPVIRHAWDLFMNISCTTIQIKILWIIHVMVTYYMSYIKSHCFSCKILVFHFIRITVVAYTSFMCAISKVIWKHLILFAGLTKIIWEYVKMLCLCVFFSVWLIKSGRKSLKTVFFGNHNFFVLDSFSYTLRMISHEVNILDLLKWHLNAYELTKKFKLLIF
jgi:hypothetical protein